MTKSPSSSVPGRTSMTDSDPSPCLDDEALDWLVRLTFGQASSRDHAEWRARSPAHAAAARAAETLWRDLGRTRTARQFAARTVGAEAARPRWTRRAVLGGALAAGMAAITVGSLGRVSSWGADYRTSVGERRSVLLPDGSSVTLNTESALSVRFVAGERRVLLLGGEAFFQVAKDPARPFVVEAGPGQARALGTAFSVRRDGEGVEVAVTEGVVQVDGADGSSARLGAGHVGGYGDSGHVRDVRGGDVAAMTAWQRGKLIFNQRPLSDVVAELERYRHGRILIADASLRTMPVTGVFDLDDSLGTLRAIEQTLKISVTRLPWLIVLG